MNLSEDYSRVHGWFVLLVGRHLAAKIAARVDAALDGAGLPSLDGVRADLDPVLVYARQVAFVEQHDSARGLWVAWTAAMLIEGLWPAVASRAWPPAGVSARGAREGWLRVLTNEEAMAIRSEIDEATEERWRDVDGAELVRALGRDAIEVGTTLRKLGAGEGAIARQAGERALEALDVLGELRPSWTPIEAAMAAANRTGGAA